MDLLRSLPLGLYLEEPVTWLHRLDPRVKLVWLMGFLLSPILANSLWRVGLVAALVILTCGVGVPLRVWRQQMGWLLVLGTMVLALTAISPDGLPAQHQPRRPSQALTELPTLELENSVVRNPWYNPLGWGQKAPTIAAPEQPLPPASDYRYVVFDRGPITITRRALDLGIRVATLVFTLIYSTNLYLLTTSPEEITAGLEDVLSPLRWCRVPVTEITLTLTLALRFIPLVMEEVQNLVRSVWTRAIDWKKLGLRQGAQVWLQIAERLLLNLLLRAEQIANAIQVRGFTTPSTHRVQWHDLRLRLWDRLALVGLVLFCGARVLWGQM
ncbi:energy-coupling factor transporter transmembrane component T family protein [Prochlorothrix hollandica]|uniref:energy-coupling factor transporter transmembrane component T family protein n=1 Tax=Prochlorothrix hollandica TaxID=1223 RepID=UPI00334207BB